MRRIGAVAALVLVVLAGVLVYSSTRPEDTTGSASSAPTPSSSSKPTPNPTANPTASPTASPTPAPSTPSCPSTGRPFAPTRITVPGVAKNVVVTTPARDANDVPGIPPLTDAGKRVFAFDREQGVRPGDRSGNVLLNAHTYPDGSALGNQLLSGLARGDRIVVTADRKRLCYRVTDEVQVLASKGLADYYAKDGRPQLAIVVCSGRRLGPGQWEKRTIWFASPSA